MKTIKEKIKQFLPDKWLYDYSTVKLVFPYLRARRELKEKRFPNIKMYSDEESVDLIVSKGMSLCRFGDGEFSWMMGRELDSFQNYSKDLEKALKTTISSNDDRLLIGIPVGMIDASRCNLRARLHWTIIKNRFFLDVCCLLDESKTYCNASITRPYIDYHDREYSKACFNNLKRIWDDRDLVIVEGEKTKLGIGNDLFDNARSIRRIICPAQNAFDKIQQITDTVTRVSQKKDLILAALGPTATVLAARVCALGYQIVDIGHIDIEYMWFLHRSILRDPIEGKYVNESGIRECSSFYDRDEQYVDSIVERIL